MSTPTSRSLAALRERGYLAQVVERWNPAVHIRNDLFGFIDILAIKDGETLAVQTTSASNISSRIRKIAESEHVAAVREAGWRIEVHGWKKNAQRRWVCRIEDVS